MTSSSSSIPQEHKSFSVYPVPCLSDNYAYIIVDHSKKSTALVDPVEPNLVIDALQQLGISLENVEMILTTHRHHDHAGGNKEIARLIPHATIYGGKLDDCEAVTHPLKGNETIELGTTSIKCLLTPCHTRGHICYVANDLYQKDGKPSALFSGDTLFIGGCGRLFEGNAEMMYHNLTGTLSTLDDNTRIYSGHEYTISNLYFGLEMAEDRLLETKQQGGNDISEKQTQYDDIKHKLSNIIQAKKAYSNQVDNILGNAENADVKSKFELGPKLGFGRYSTQGSTMEEEKKTNIFMFSKDPTDFATFRTLKDSWRGPRKELE